MVPGVKEAEFQESVPTLTSLHVNSEPTPPPGAKLPQLTFGGSEPSTVVSWWRLNTLINQDRSDTNIVIIIILSLLKPCAWSSDSEKILP